VKNSILQTAETLYIERESTKGIRTMKFDLREVCHAFDLRGEYVIGVPFGTGHINDTFAVTYDQGGAWVRYIVQRINTNVFKQPEQLMENFQRVTGHIANKLRYRRSENPALRHRTLELVPAKDGLPFHRDADGNFFRCYVFVENARTYDILETETQAFEAGAAFGGFQADLADLEWRLHETIPNFHNTVSRLAALERAAKEDKCGRRAEIMPELDFIRERAPECSELLDLQASGEITERTTHNDTKLNNVLIDDLTGSGCCVIDLDTVMPGLPHYDFGDMVRTGTSPASEDERDLAKVTMRFQMYESLLCGYLTGAGKFLSPLEKSLLPFAGKLITLETAIRFLTDHLEGDVYFRIHRPDHNLDRCRTQIALVKSIETQYDAMRHLADSL